MARLFIWTYFLFFGIANLSAQTAVSQKNTWLILEIGTIGTASAEMLSSAIERVETEQFEGLIIQLDTPGGTLDATRAMVKNMLGSPKPVIVWVGPGGSRAGSAGAFITLAGHIAAMAPGTNIGAAHPVQANGQDIDSSDARDKVTNDTMAFMESIADRRNRNKDMALSFVENSVSITAEEALENKVIDMIADSPEDILSRYAGKEIKLNDQTSITLDTSDDRVIAYEKSLREKFLEIISNPNVFYLLFIAGLIGLGIELTNPGVLVPGVIGAICLIMALISTSVLPISFGAIILIFVSVAFVVAEIFVPSFGILGIGGFIGFVIGSLLLVDSSNELGLSISAWTIVPAALAIAVFALIAAFFIVKTERSPVKSGIDDWAGKQGEAITDFELREGKIRVEGEIWSARNVGDQPIAKGTAVTINKIDGLTLEITETHS